MPNKSFEDFSQEIHQKIDDYNIVLEALVCIGDELKFNTKKGEIYPDAKMYPFIKLATSNNNKVSKNTIITPDLAVIRNKNYGLICELKTGLDKDQTHWNKTTRQMHKYDDTLKGFVGIDSTAFNHDLMLLLPLSVIVNYIDYMNNKKDDFRFDRKFSLISYVREVRDKTFLCFRKEYGEISDTEKDDLLRKIVRVHLKRIQGIYSLKFYDQKPPIVYTINEIWTNMANFKHYTLTRKKETFIRFTEDKILENMRASNTIQNSDNTPIFPKRNWIRDSLKEMVSIKLLQYSTRTKEYFISYTKYENVRNPLDTFIKKIYESSTKRHRQHAKQASLLNLLPS